MSKTSAKLQWHLCATLPVKVATSLPSEKEELACRNTRRVATTLYVPIRVFSPMIPRHSLHGAPIPVERVLTSVDCCRLLSISADAGEPFALRRNAIVLYV